MTTKIPLLGGGLVALVALAIGGCAGTRPAPETAHAESPQSVTTTGIPQAIASPTTFGKPSPFFEVSVARSRAL